MDLYTLVLGLPHTNHLGLAEHLLLGHAGHFQWTSIARAFGRPLSTLRTVGGQEIYATFYYIEERFPDGSLSNTFQLDDCLTFAVSLRAFKDIAIEGEIVFDHQARLEEWLATASVPSAADAAAHPYIRFANIFITPEGGNSELKVASPANVAFSGIPKLPPTDSAYHLTRPAQATGRLGVLDNGWISVDIVDGFEVSYPIDIDRDTNGAGLVYFANYFTFLDRAEREAMRTNSRGPFTEAEVASRLVQHRRTAFYGNVDTSDRVRTRVQLFESEPRNSRMGARYQVRRESDDRLICLSEAVKIISARSGRQGP